MVSPGILRLALLLGAAPLVGGAALAQDDAAKPAASAAADDDGSNPIDPEAMAAVDKMSAALQALSSFHTKSDITTEVVLATGQKIQFGGTMDTYARRPNAFKIVTRLDGKSRELYYDGKTFTIFAPTLGYYADFPAPGTIAATIDKASDEFGIEVPLADLFTWGSDPAIRARVQEAMVIRPETIGDRTCMHYAFRQEHADWQVWIDQGGKALPCKIVITNKTDPAMPQYSAVIDWASTAVPASENLAFSPPADAHRIAIADISEITSDGEGQ
ncbi:DUF2092 domain-containing protein [Sphingopyxis indica]|uniref:DUF2092 domain-containing protein n=1 Tax=Sphingopyxis indica TaxID=436663 RepID=A0A239DDU8_9SPHN|nr:DUF2092 domain-containing protein [Sphingopyxis indica]SNS30616.1 hypothetical protein SAMN06295955_101222 [Sphingopyxis indica]